jgi:hypothetical protein
MQLHRVWIEELGTGHPTPGVAGPRVASGLPSWGLLMKQSNKGSRVVK